MNEIEKRAITRWLVGQLAAVARMRKNNNLDVADPWAKGYMLGEELTLTKIAVRLFGTEAAVDIVNEAEKEAKY